MKKLEIIENQNGELSYAFNEFEDLEIRFLKSGRKFCVSKGEWKSLGEFEKEKSQFDEFLNILKNIQQITERGSSEIGDTLKSILNKTPLGKVEEENFKTVGAIDEMSDSKNKNKKFFDYVNLDAVGENSTIFINFFESFFNLKTKEVFLDPYCEHESCYFLYNDYLVKIKNFQYPMDKIFETPILFELHKRDSTGEFNYFCDFWKAQCLFDITNEDQYAVPGTIN